METTTEKSLSDLMNEAFNISLDCAYADITPNGHYLTPRFELMNDEESDTVGGWCDGLMHKYYEDRSTGHCSLQSTIDFDVAAFEQAVIADINKMEIILARLGKPIKLDVAEMKRRGYHWKSAGE